MRPASPADRASDVVTKVKVRISQKDCTLEMHLMTEKALEIFERSIERNSSKAEVVADALERFGQAAVSGPGLSILRTIGQMFPCGLSVYKQGRELFERNRTNLTEVVIYHVTPLFSKFGYSEPKLSGLSEELAEFSSLLNGREPSSGEVKELIALIDSKKGPA